MKRTTRAELGFTLIELLIVLAIGAGIVLALSAAFSTAMRSYPVSFGQSRDALAGQTILNQIAKELRYATNPSLPSVTPANSKITYTLNGSSKSIYWGSGSDANTLIIDGETPVQKLGKGLVQSAPVFSISGKKVTITLTIQDNSDSPSPSLTLTTTVYLLNQSGT